MKKLLVILSLAFAAISFQAEAATLNLTNLTDASTDSGTLVINGQEVCRQFLTRLELNIRFGHIGKWPHHRQPCVFVCTGHLRWRNECT